MDHLTQIIIAVFASSGFWALLNAVITNIQNKKRGESEKIKVLESGVRGLLHEKLIERCKFYLSEGTITEPEYNDLKEYIFTPYKGLNGNGTGDEYMRRVKELLFKTEV